MPRPKLPTLIALMMLACTSLGALPVRAWQVPPPGEHPRLVFSVADLPALRAKLNDSRGQRLFALVRAAADNWVLKPSSRVNQIRTQLAEDKRKAEAAGGATKMVPHGAYDEALALAENAALVYVVTGEEQYGQAARDMLVTFAPYAPATALRAKALVYDWCYPLFTEAERTMIRENLVGGIEAALKTVHEAAFALGPCPLDQVPMANYWGMLTGGYAGIGALALEGEPGYKPEWVATAEEATLKSMNRFLDEEGYHESGPAYVAYSFLETNYWLEAMRLRGTDWSKHPRLNKMPIWLTYLTLPGSIGVTNKILVVGNSNFGTLQAHAGLAWLHHACPQNAWASLMYDFVTAPASVYGVPSVVNATFLWDTPLLPSPDLNALPHTKWFPDGGVFMRTGWDAQALAFWIRTVEYRRTPGGMEDYGSFCLNAYGEPFAVEAGAKEVPAAVHNLVFIDGKGSDRSGYEVIPRAPLVDLVASGFASAALVDQKEAYSEDLAFEGPERKLVSKPLNPVEKAQRIGVTVWGGQHAGPYCLMVDDMVKDGQPHDFQWRMMTNPNYKVDPHGDHLTLSREKAPAETWLPPMMDAQLLSPSGKLALVTETQGEKTIPRLLANLQAINPHFTVVLYPRPQALPELSATKLSAEGGHAAVLKWPECVDRVVVSYGDEIEIAGIKTDAKLVVVRTALPPVGAAEAYGPVLGVLMVQGTRLTVEGKSLVRAKTGRCSLAWEAATATVALGRGAERKNLALGVPVKQSTHY